MIDLLYEPLAYSYRIVIEGKEYRLNLRENNIQLFEMPSEAIVFAMANDWAWAFEDGEGHDLLAQWAKHTLDLSKASEVLAHADYFLQDAQAFKEFFSRESVKRITVYPERMEVGLWKDWCLGGFSQLAWQEEDFCLKCKASFVLKGKGMYAIYSGTSFQGFVHGNCR